MNFKRLQFIILIALFTQGVFVTAAHAKDTSYKNSPSVEVIVETTMGSFTLELNPEKAPKTVANFLVYVDEGFYNNTLFHRVIPRFVVQGGGFEKGMGKKPTRFPVKNESDNGLKNIRSAVSMARTNNPNSATSQFFINDRHNLSLDYRDNKPGYTVFGKVTEGMDIIDKIIRVPTTTSGSHKNVPKDDVVILSAKRKGSTGAQDKKRFIAGEHYVVLDKPVATRDSSKIEVVEMFSYACSHCYEFEPLIKEWSKQQANDVDFWYFPAVWNKTMKLFARAFYTAQELNITEKIHLPLFTAIVIEQKRLSNESDLADFFAHYGVDKKDFAKAFNSTAVDSQLKQAKARVRSYKPAGVPEIIVNGKYRIDRMRAGGQTEMLA
ncbi:MAG: peptidylprolyl isomerase, partial [Candidatus Desulfatibia sp.]|uniref:peptidylprolyl isomerase n=1 Tax=Candidatus Desulfatibia sp. TaxID=3101189 RepID=UPI002F305AE8